MIKIEKYPDTVKVYLPIKTLIFDRAYFDWFSDNIYFFYTQSHTSTKIIREKGNIEDMNMGHWLCLKNHYQPKFNDSTIKCLDVESIVQGYSKLDSIEMSV